jgi:Ca2+-binding EF-hand superfamily protein
MSRACGTIYTAAPEVLMGTTYTTQTDVWSAGVCCWCLLIEDTPFMTEIEDMKDPAQVEKLKQARIEFTHPRWTTVSKLGREFVAMSLRRHPGSRWVSKDALAHIEDKWLPTVQPSSDDPPPAPSSSGGGGGGIKSFFGSGSRKSSPAPASPPGTPRRKRINSIVVNSMKDFGGYGKLKKKILMTMAYTMDKSELKELREIFNDLDENKEGTIHLEELKHALRNQRSESSLSDEQIQDIFSGLDYDNSGEVHYKEFLAAAAEAQGLITHERLLEAFDRMDSDNSGFISKENLKDLLGKDYDEALAVEMMGDSGEIDYERFLEVVFDKTIALPLSP